MARLATTDPDGRPHLVPIVFALDGGTPYSAVDRKPKRSSKLRRIENVRGRARMLDDGEERDRALALLQEKYSQYRTNRLDGPVLAVHVTEVREWSA